jgi:type I restriction enzyme M protein
MTPRPLAQLMVRLAAPIADDSIHDPCMGIGTILAAAVAQADPAAQLLALSGQEIQPGVAALARLRLFLLGARNVRVHVGDVLRNPAFVQRETHTTPPGWRPFEESGGLETFDVVLCDPPYGQRFGDIQFAESDQYRRFVYGLPGRTSGDMTFIQHTFACLKPTGRAVVLIPHGPLFRGGADMEVRHNMIAGDIIDAVIGLPAGMLPGLSLELALLICRRNKKDLGREAHVLFIDASQQRDAPGNPAKWQTLADEIVSICADPADRPSLSRVVARAEIEANEFSLQPRRYIARQDPKDRIDIQSTMAEARDLEHAAVRYAEAMEQLLGRLIGGG